MKKFEIHFRCPHEGMYVYSSSGCGEDSCIRIAHVEEFEKTFSICISCEEAKDFANAILKVVKDYKNGKETGLYGDGK